MEEIINNQILYCMLGPNIANEELRNDKMNKIKEVRKKYGMISRVFSMKDLLLAKSLRICSKRRSTRA